MKQASVATLQSEAAVTTPQQSSEREDRSTRGGRSKAAHMETRQNDHGGENTLPQNIGFVPITSSPSMSNLVINNDLNGSTEVQLTTTADETPPTSPMNRKSMTPDSPSLSGESTQSSSKDTKSCQKRGRFLVWPVAPPPYQPTSASAATTAS